MFLRYREAGEVGEELALVDDQNIEFRAQPSVRARAQRALHIRSIGNNMGIHPRHSQAQISRMASMLDCGSCR